MGIATRLDKLMPALSVRERISLILRAAAAGTEPDPELMNLTTLKERQEYDRYAALIIAANHSLGAQVQALVIIALDLESRTGDVELLKSVALLAAEQEGTVSPLQPVRHWRRLKTIETGVFLASVAEDIRRALLAQLELRWQEMRALEVVWAEVAAEFEGEDPRQPELQAKAAEVSQQLRGLLQRVAGKARRLPEPGEELLGQMRDLVEQAFGHFSLRVTRA